MKQVTRKASYLESLLVIWKRRCLWCSIKPISEVVRNSPRVLVHYSKKVY